MAPAVGFSGRRQFDVACGVLSRCVKAQGAATAGVVTAAAPAAPPPTMLLMPGADVTPDNVTEEEREATQLAARLTIMYGGDRVLVFDDFPSYRVAELVLVAERLDVPGPGAGGTTADIPVARKASLQRFMEKRRDRRLVACAPYAARPAPASSNKERNQLGEQDDDAGSWLGLGVPGGCASS